MPMVVSCQPGSCLLSLHKHAGEAMAILAGDAMLALAFRVIAKHSTSDIASRLVSELANATTCMIAGQVHDTLGGTDSTLPALDQVRTIHRDKTGALFRAAASSLRATSRRTATCRSTETLGTDFHEDEAMLPTRIAWTLLTHPCQFSRAFRKSQ